MKRILTTLLLSYALIAAPTVFAHGTQLIRRRAGHK